MSSEGSATKLGSYQEGYFRMQAGVGEFGGREELFKFRDFVKPTDSVLDFGCGGGYLLYHLNCARRLGVEINPAAREQAARLGIETVARVEEVPSGFANIVISNHALEHVHCPFEILRSLHAKIKPGGMFVCVVPHQGPREPYRKGDVHQHLYTWNALTLGNLFDSAGYSVVQAGTIRHKWPPGYRALRKYLGEFLFHFLCRSYAFVRSVHQVRVVATR